MAINVPLNAQFQNADQAATYLQGVCQSAVNKVKFNLGGASGAKAFSSLSQPLGRLTGQADEFTKSLDAANARVLAFGASVGVVNAVTNAFKSLVSSTIEVEKAITAISVVGDQFTGKTKELSQGLFNIAKETGQSFSEVSKAALEFSRQGLKLEDTLSRTKDALILTRTTGLETTKSVEGLSAAVSAFAREGLSASRILNKLAAVDQAFKVSSADLIQAFERTGAAAQQAGVTFDELAGIVTALQADTSRGGAVIGNSLKTIFTRLGEVDKLEKLKGVGIIVQDLSGEILPASKILQNLANDVQGFSKLTQSGIFKDIAGTFQINQLIALVGDLTKKNSIAAEATKKSAGATNEAYVANEKLNQSLDAILNKVANTGKQLGSILGELGLTDNLNGLLDGINSFLEGANSLLQGDDLGSNFAKGFVKGIGGVLSGPGLGIFLAIIGKLSLDLAKFGLQSLKAFFGIGKAAADQKLVQESIVQTLIRNQGIANAILSTQGGQNAQALKFLGLLNQQAAAMQTIQGVAGGIASPVYAQGYRATSEGLQRKSKAAGGYLPAQEASDVRRGVGGASPSSKVVSIPNFAFGGGKRGTMIANTSEYIVPNYAGGGSAIFNQDMVKSMGLPAGAKKISAAGGFVPNFSPTNKLKAGRDLESRIFNFFGLPPAGNRNLDFPEGVLTGVSSQLKNQIGLKGSFGDLKLTNSQYNQTSLLGRLIQEFDLFDELNKSLYKKKNAQNVNLNSLNPKVGKSSLFFPGDPNIFEPKDISASWAAIRKANKNKPNFLSKFDSIIYGSDGSLKSGAIGSKVSAKILIDGVSDPQNTASGGYIPNFAENDTNKQLAILGLYGKNGDIDGSPVYTLSSQRPNLFKDIKGNLEKNVTNLVKSYASRIGKKINVPVVQKDIKKSLNQIPSMSGFMFEDVLNQLAGPNFDTATESSGSRIDFPLTQGLREVFGVTGPQKYAEAKLDPYTADAAGSVRAKQKALAAGALGPQERTGDALSALRARAIELRIGVSGRPSVRGGKEGSAPVPTQAEKNAFIKKLIDDGIIESDIKNSADQSKAIKRKLGIASGGYIPNFVDFNKSEDYVTKQRKKSREARTYRSASGVIGSLFKSLPEKFFVDGVLGDAMNGAETSGILKLIKDSSYYMASFGGPKALNFVGQVEKNGLKVSEGLKKKLAQLTVKVSSKIGRSSSGYVPNFAAAALQQAIAREKSAGLSDSQIYVDQDSALKSSMNPMGLMVANRRDEPAGGLQGIARARKEGVNPKLYGAASGFVPNYAVPSGLSGYAASLNPPVNPGNVEAVDKGFGDLAGKLIIAQTAMSFFSGSVDGATDKTSKLINALSQTVGSLVQFSFLLQGTKLGEKIIGSFKGLLNKIPGVGRIAGAAQGAAGGISGFAGGVRAFAGKAAGPLGLAAGGAFLLQGAASGIKEYFRKDLSGTFDRLEESANKAASQLDSVGKETAKYATTQADTLGFMERFGLQVSRFFLQDATKINVGGNVKKITSTSNSATSEQLEQLRNSLIQAEVAAGATAQDAVKKSFEFLQTLDKRPQRFQRNPRDRRPIPRGDIELDLTQADTVQALITQYERLGIVAAEVAKRNDFARAQELAQERTDSLVKTLNLNKEVVIALQVQYSKLQDAILQVDIDTAFQKLTNKTLVDLDTSLSASQRSIEEFKNSIKEIELDFRVDEAKALSSELLKINTDVSKALEKVGVSIGPDKVKSIQELQKAVVSGNLEQLPALTKALSGLEGVDLTSLREATRNIETQGKELERQLKLKITQSRLDFAAKTIADQQTFAIQKQNQAIDSQLKLLEKRRSIQDKELEYSRRIEDAQFEKSTVGLSERGRTVAERNRANTVERQRSQQDIIREFQQGLIESLRTTEIPDNISADKQSIFRKRIANRSRTLSNLQQEPGQSPEEFIEKVSNIFQKSANNLTKEIAVAEKAASDAALEAATNQANLTIVNAQIAGEAFKVKILEAASGLVSIIEQVKLTPEQATKKQEFEKRLADVEESFKSGKIDQAQYSSERSGILQDLSKITPQYIAPNTSNNAQPPVPKEISDLEAKAEALRKQIQKNIDDELKNTIKLNNAEASTATVKKGLAAVSAETDAKVAGLSQKLREMGDATVILSNLIRDYIEGLPSELANLQFGALQSKSPDDLVSKLIGQQAINETAGLTGEERVKEIAAITALREKGFELATAESATRRRELEYELKYLKEFLALKEQGATVEELADLKNKQTAEQRSGGRGFEKGLDTIQDRINNYRTTLGEEIPNLFSSNLAQGLNDAISGAKDLKTALTDAATSFFQEITRKNISNLADMVTGGIGKGASSGGGILSSIFSFFGGGSKTGVTAAASGGMIKGGSGTKDDVPAMLMGGEYVVKKSAVNKYGKGFLDALNNGKMRGYATGGLVDPETFPTQTGRGGFYTPGDYGQGAITGKNELLTFATQSFTSGQYDYMGGFGMSGASVGLEPESARLSSFGRENSPMFERVQQSKDEAFKVYLEGLQKEKEYAELLDQIAKDKKARKKQLQSAIISAVVTSALNAAGGAMSAGASNAAGAAKAAGKGFLGQASAGFKGAFGFGGKTGQGGLGNLFTGNFSKAFTNLGSIAKAQGITPEYNFDANKSLRGVTVGNKSYPAIRGGGFSQRASGGLISGGSNIRDDVPAMLTGGEFVLNNRATQRIGVQNLNQLNNGQSVGGEGASAEMTQALISKLDELIQATQNSSSENVVVNVSSNEAGGQNQENTAGAEKELHKKIRQAVLDVIAQEKRLGGSLEKSR